MQIVNVGSLYNLAQQAVNVPSYNAVGICVISAAFPRYTQISAAGGGQANVPLLRGQKLWLPSREAYNIVYPDTWAGNIDTSSYGNYDDFEVANPPHETKAKGTLRAVLFQNKEEFENYQVGRLEDVVFIPRIEGLDSGSERYSLHNVDFDSMTLQVKNVSNGYYNAFRVEEGNETNPADLDNFAQVTRIQLGYITANYLTAASDCNGGFLNLTNVSNIRIHQIASDASSGSQRALLYMRFQDGQGLPAAGKRQGRQVLKMTLTTAALSTGRVDIPVIGGNSWAIALINTGALSVTTRVFRMMQRYDTNTYVDVSSDVIGSGAHAAGATRPANNFGIGQNDLMRISVDNTLNATPNTMMILLSGYI